MIKPSKYPDWTINPDGSDNDVIDPTTGENNVDEPSAGKKLLGWEYNEKPPRQYFNWLSRLTSQWIRWFDKGGIPNNYLSGFKNNFDSEQKIKFNPGTCKDSTNEIRIKTTEDMTKKINENWVSGNGNGGFPSNLSISNNEFYLTFVIYNENTDETDFGFDINSDCSNLLSDTGFTHFRRIGSVFYNSSGEIKDFYQKGDLFLWKETISETLDLSTAAGGGTNAILISTKKVLPSSKIESDLGLLFCQLSEPENADNGNGIYCSLWPDGTPLDITGVVSNNNYDAKYIISSKANTIDGVAYSIESRNMSGSGLMTKPIHFAALNDLIFILSDRESGISNNITYYVYGFSDLRGQK